MNNTEVVTSPFETYATTVLKNSPTASTEKSASSGEGQLQTKVVSTFKMHTTGVLKQSFTWSHSISVTTIHLRSSHYDSSARSSHKTIGTTVLKNIPTLFIENGASAGESKFHTKVVNSQKIQYTTKVMKTSFSASQSKSVEISHLWSGHYDSAVHSSGRTTETIVLKNSPIFSYKSITTDGLKMSSKGFNRNIIGNI